MILLAHLLFGAAIGSVMKNIPLAIVLAFLSHYLLDLFPHVEYNIENIEKKQWRRALPQFLRVFFDFLIGIILISIFSKNQLIIYACAFFAILPDGISILSSVVKIDVLKKCSEFHREKVHFLKYKKISNFWRIASQIIIIAISIFLMTYKF